VTAHQERSTVLPTHRLRWPHLTVRTRLTLLYGGMVLLAGGVLLGIFYLIFVKNLPGSDFTDRLAWVAADATRSHGVYHLPSGRTLTEQDVVALRRDWADARTAIVHNLIWQCLAALGAVALVAVAFGWAVAGRALRPVHDITATARRVADRNLHERIELDGPPDEIKELADTFDAMLERLDSSFSSQRRFVANASHELRTPLATTRTLLEVALAQHDMPPAVREVIETALETNRRNELMIDGLLTLARSENQAIRRHAVDLSDIAAGVVEQTAPEAAAAGVTVDAAPDPALANGDPILLERLTLNLVYNAIRHNHRGGTVTVTTGGGTAPGRVELVVTNTGPVVRGSDLDAMFEPFRRLGDTRAGNGQGVGLGLSIVRSIVRTHGGDLTATPREGGGLMMRIELPAAALAARPTATG
jgi:signal transduction histidine kinase